MREQVERDGRCERLVAVAEDGGDAGEGGKLVGRTLGVAAGDDDARIGVAAMGAANVGARGAVCLCSDGAGVDEDEIGTGGQRIGLAGCGERGADGLCVGAGGAATEVFNMERHRAALWADAGPQAWETIACCSKGKVARRPCKGSRNKREGARLDARAAQAGRECKDGRERFGGCAERV